MFEKRQVGMLPVVSACGDWLLAVGGFTSWQHLRLYQNGNILVIVHINSDFIVLPHWEIGLPTPDIPLSHINLIL